MTQSKSRRLLYQQARLIRIQWAVILALVCTIVLMAIFLPKAKAVEETAAPTLELEPTSYATPEIMPELIIEIEPEETEPVLEELGEFRLTAYTATAAWLTAATGVGEAVIIAGANGYLGLAKSDHKRGGITFEAAKAKDFTEDEDKNSPPI